MRKLRLLLSTYREAGGGPPIVLLHDEAHGADLVDALARFGDGLPPHVLPLAVNEVRKVLRSDGSSSTTKTLVGCDDMVGLAFRTGNSQTEAYLIIVCVGGIEIDTDARQVRLDGETRALTSYQFALLLALAQRAGRVLSRETLMDLVSHDKLEAFDRSIDVHISRIRAAIEDDPKKPRRVITVRGAGYVFAKAQE